MMTITGRHTVTMITTTVILQLGKSNMSDLQYELNPHEKFEQKTLRDTKINEELKYNYSFKETLLPSHHHHPAPCLL